MFLHTLHGASLVSVCRTRGMFVSAQVDIGAVPSTPDRVCTSPVSRPFSFMRCCLTWRCTATRSLPSAGCAEASRGRGRRGQGSDTGALPRASPALHPASTEALLGWGWGVRSLPSCFPERPSGSAGTAEGRAVASRARVLPSPDLGLPVCKSKEPDFLPDVISGSNSVRLRAS